MKRIYKPYCRIIKVSSDDRGVFAPFLELNDVLADNEKNSIRRVYFVYNYGDGVVRGFHFHQKEWKYFTVVYGAAKIVAINPKNPKEKYDFISSSRFPNLVIIPPGFANGWVSLENNTILLCCSTSTLDESIKDDKRFDPYKWGDVWKAKGR